MVNLTLEIGPDDLQLNIVAWTGAQTEKFEPWLRSGREPHPLAELSDLDLVVFKRRAKRDKNGNPFWMGASSTELDRVSAGTAAQQLGGLPDQWQAQVDPTWERLAYHLRHSWLRTEVTEMGDGLVDDLVARIERLIPIVDEINGSRP